eukprot:Skav200360  [mRNA]  locus=scaffold2518:53283:53714:- [translate_table: standard]
MLGLDNAGKTTILHQAGLADVLPTIPRIGFHVETGRCSKSTGIPVTLTFTVWDLGGPRMRRIFQEHYEGVDGLVFVVDSHDSDRLNNAKEELQQLILDVQKAPLLVVANKQDLPGRADSALRPQSRRIAKTYLERIQLIYMQL